MSAIRLTMVVALMFKKLAGNGFFFRELSAGRLDFYHKHVKTPHRKLTIGDAPAEGFWFEELFKRGVMGLNASVGPREEAEAKRAWLDSWGYGAAPFFADVGGLLTWSVAEGRFMFCAQRRTSGLLIPAEAIYAAATIGLMAIDLFTTTGARINEVMQIRLTEDCIVRLQMAAPPGASDQSPRIRYILRLVPKGEKTN